ncbi:SDR family oxidoreductase [Paenarthrobacter nitroguajacolicus]|uniref:SDR family oxidoreductase n=1 Tax=Paenarthrobacter nitroguajacolicus TaxID=211146 RepID=A0A558GNA0_PAENT|nr:MULTISPECIES: SDR family oxidoreductase [Paenarthrobacter]MCM0616874.1 SDR family oxidoreductase [Paenarthrobacter sp. TYUT067]TVU58370.1 SDR family oxidoreductase [Paenarthrobacter nitroguajacolicus]
MSAGMLEGKTVLVTGGSRGIGRATVETMHREGAHVVLHYANNKDSAQATADRLGQRVNLVQGNLLDPAERARIWAEAADWRSGIDVLVNNAGAWLASDIDDSDAWQLGWEANYELNLLAPADLCREAILGFRRRGGGIIVNVTSRSAHRGDDADHLAYGAAKGGLLALTKGIARGFGKENILAYAIAPGWVATDIAGDLAEDPSVLAGLPLGEVTPPQDVAEVITFLASGRSRHATGATIDITGADYVR